MEALSRILESILPGPWPSAIVLTVLAIASMVYRIYSRALSERGPAAKRIRQNLEKSRSDLREHYFYVLLSLRRTLDDNLGPAGSIQYFTRSFEIFLKLSALYSLGTLLLVYLVSGKSPAFFQLFTSISVNERGVLALCSILSLVLSVVFFLESNRNIIDIARRRFFCTHASRNRGTEPWRRRMRFVLKLHDKVCEEPKRSYVIV